MSEAREHIEHAAHGHETPPAARRAAIVIAVLAAVLALIEFGAKGAQVAYLTDHIAASDTWTQYQAKVIRRTVYDEAASVLEGLPNGGDAAIRQRAAAARQTANRMRSEPGADGMEQLAERAHDLEHARDHALHRTHGLETASGGLQIAIVLASVSVVTGIRWLMTGGVALGLAAAVYAVLASQSLV